LHRRFLSKWKRGDKIILGIPDFTNKGENKMEKELKGINIATVFKLTFALGLIGLAIMAVIMLIITIISDISGLMGWLAFVLFGVLWAVLYGAMAAFMAWLYNIVASKVGGIKVTLE
jgi:hypothetical protein